MIDLGPLVRAGSSTAAGVSPLAAIGIAGTHTRLIWIVATAPTGGWHALALVTQRVRIAHQSGNFSSDVSRKGHGKPRIVITEIILALPSLVDRGKKIFLAESAGEVKQFESLGVLRVERETEWGARELIRSRKSFPNFAVPSALGKAESFGFAPAPLTPMQDHARAEPPR
jgi:hypothetical protein